MPRLVLRATAAAVLLFGCAALAGRRPAIDVSAMREAIESSRSVDDFASADAYAHFLRSRLYHHAGDHVRAAAELRQALATDDDSAYLRTALAEEYARQGEMIRAQAELRNVLDAHPDDAPACLLLGRVLFEDKQFAKAKLLLRRAIKLRPTEPDAYLVLAQLGLETAAPEEAVKAVDALSAAVPGEAVGDHRLGLALAERGDLARARPLLERAVQKDPADLEAWSALGQLDESIERTDLAEHAYEQALIADPDNTEVLLAEGRLALRRHGPAQARAYFDRLLSISDEPEQVVKVAFSFLAARELSEAVAVLDAARKRDASEPRFSFYAGLLHERLGHHAEAAQAFGEVSSASELYDDASLRRATSLSRAGQHEQARALLEKAIAERPESLDLYPAYARVLERAGKVREAETFLRRSLERAPTASLYEALCNLLDRHGREADGVALLQQAVTAHPKDEALLYTLAAVYERHGELAQSLSRMRQVVAMNPENAAALNFIGYTLVDHGQSLDEAEQLLRRAVQLRPDSGAFLDSLGWLYFRKGDRARAVDTLEKAVDLAPGEPTILEHLGDAYRGADRATDAAGAYRRALEALTDQDDDDPAGEALAQRAGLLKKLKFLGTDAAAR